MVSNKYVIEPEFEPRQFNVRAVPLNHPVPFWSWWFKVIIQIIQAEQEEIIKTHTRVHMQLQEASCPLFLDLVGSYLYLLANGPVHQFSLSELERGSQRNKNNSNTNKNTRLGGKRKSNKKKDENWWFIFSANTHEWAKIVSSWSHS